MKIEVIPDKADQAGLEMLELSRMLRQAREEVEEVRRQLRRHSQLEECRYALQNTDHRQLRQAVLFPAGDRSGVPPDRAKEYRLH